MNYVNIDALSGRHMKKENKKDNKKPKFTLKKIALMTALSATIIGGAKIKDSNDKANEHAQMVKEIEASTEKMYSVYTVKKGDTLTSIAEKYREATPELKVLYDLNEYIEMIAKTSGVTSNNVLEIGQTLWIPNLVTKQVAKEKSDFYKNNQEEARELSDYEDYHVKIGDNYWKIACLYTDNEQEQASIVAKIQNLNNNEMLVNDTTIKIPNIEKYKLLHQEYEVETEEISRSR